MHTISINTEKLPNRISASTVAETKVLLEDLLLNLGYKGAWQLRFAMQLRQKSNSKFKLVRQEGRGIRIRTKCGGNDTCWESILTPPSDTLTQDVVNELAKVHPRKLDIAIPRVREDNNGRSPQEKIDSILRVEPIPTHAIGSILCGRPDKHGITCSGPAVEMLITPTGEYTVCAKHLMDPRWFGMVATVKRAQSILKDDLERQEEQAEAQREKARRTKIQREKTRQAEKLGGSRKPEPRPSEKE